MQRVFVSKVHKSSKGLTGKNMVTEEERRADLRPLEEETLPQNETNKQKRKEKLRAGEMVQWAESLLCKHSDLSSDHSTCVKSQTWLFMAVTSIVAWGTGGSLDFTSCQPRLFQANKAESSRGRHPMSPLVSTYMQGLYIHRHGVGVDR